MTKEEYMKTMNKIIDDPKINKQLTIPPKTISFTSDKEIMEWLEDWQADDEITRQKENNLL